MPYHPETTVVRSLARINRERKLPSDAVPRQTYTHTGLPVDAIYMVLQGDAMGDYQIIDVARFFKMRHADRAAELITVEAGQRVTMGQDLAKRPRGRRKLLPCPADGVITRIDGATIVLQRSAATIDVLAKIPGEVQVVGTHAVQITGNGALIQCAWGNGSFCYEAYRFVPDEGFAALSKLDVRISEYRRVVIISQEPITKGDLLVAQQQEATGVVAPSMPANLRNFAMQLKFPVLLTEGFGQRRPTPYIYQLLHGNMGRQAAFDATMPDRWSFNRPEIMIPLPTGGATPPIPVYDQALEVGMQVRIVRAPWDGWVGEVTDIPAAPQVIDSGLRLPCAKIRLPGDRVVLVPLANLELLG